MSMDLIMQLFLHLDMFMVMKIKIFDKMTLSDGQNWDVAMLLELTIVEL